jgi:hypothetical protein
MAKGDSELVVVDLESQEVDGEYRHAVVGLV